MINRHPFHAICPYFAMFPEQFVEQQLLSFTSPGDLVFDPFCGRGTTIFESLLKDRSAAGTDINSVAACIASAKANAPQLAKLIQRIDDLEKLYEEASVEKEAPTPFFTICYERQTLTEIMFLRDILKWKRSSTDCFLAAVMLGILHGESHRSEYCLSNRMPRTISTKPEYSIRWWEERKLTAPRRPVFEVLRKAVVFRYRMPPATKKGRVRQTDARKASSRFVDLHGAVKLVVTSPPYLDTTDYSEDQWLRLWFLGGASKPEIRKNKDDRHTNPAAYWKFIEEVWSGIKPLMAEESTIVVRIGGAKFTKEELAVGVTTTIQRAMDGHRVKPLHKGLTSLIRARETSGFRPGTRKANVEHDFVYMLSQ